jgi:uncharacterized protein YjbI with pentapeptide repeats
MRKSLNFIVKNILVPVRRSILFVITPPRVVAVTSIILVCLILALLDYNFFLSRQNINWLTLIASVHGIFFDSVIFCLVGIAFFGFRDRRIRIERYYEELDDFRFSDSREGVLRKESLIKKLSKLNAKTADMKGIILTGANLAGLKLSGAHFAGSKLEKVDFSKTMLNHSKFDEAGKKNGDNHALLGKADCAKTIFKGALLCDSDMKGMDFEELDFEKASLKRSRIASANLRKTNLRFADLEDTKCEEADFRGADLYESVFKNANLAHAIFSQVKDKSWDSGSCAKLTHSHMVKSNLREAMLSYTDMSHADLTGAKLFRAKMKSVNLGWAVLADAVLREADLEGADFLEADLKGADLYRANLRGAKNLSIEQIKSVKTLYLAGIDPELIDKITKSGLSHLLTKN